MVMTARNRIQNMLNKFKKNPVTLDNYTRDG